MRLIDADRLIDEFEDTIGSPIARTRLKLQVQNCGAKMTDKEVSESA